MMKIVLKIFGVFCLVWTVIATFVPCRPAERKWDGAMKESWDLITSHSSPSDGIHKEQVVPIKVGTLAELHARADEPILYRNMAQIFLWISGLFALVSGVSLILLTKKCTSAA